MGKNLKIELLPYSLAILKQTGRRYRRKRIRIRLPYSLAILKQYLTEYQHIYYKIYIPLPYSLAILKPLRTQEKRIKIDYTSILTSDSKTKKMKAFFSFLDLFFHTH